MSHSLSDRTTTFVPRPLLAAAMSRLLVDVDTRDWSGIGPAAIAVAAEAGTNGSILLMHAGPANTPRALPAIIAWYRARGFRFVTVPELMELP